MSVFVKIVDSGSLSRASVELDISPTMVGKHLRMLESHLNSKLINRTTRRISLTQVGKNYYIHCRAVLDLIEEGEKKFIKNNISPLKNITISAPDVLGNRIILPMILEYMEYNPDLNIELDLSDKLTDLTTDNIDIAIRVGEVPDSDDIIARYLANYEFTACASPKYLMKFGIPNTPYDLFNHQCISFNRSILTQWQGTEFIEKMKRSRIISFSIDAIRMSALSGMGIIIHSKIFVDDDIKSGSLIKILEDYPLPKRKISALYHINRRNDKEIKNFLDFVQMKISKLLPV